MNETFIDRLTEYMKWAGLNDNKVTVQAGLTIGLINSARKRGKSLSGDNIGKILYAYKDLNARWLLTGEGNMIEEEADSTSMNINVSKLLMMFNEKDQTCMKLLELNKNLEKEIQDLKHRLGDDEKAKVG